MSALQDGCKLEEITLSHHHIGDLILPTGQLVACDPFVLPDSPSFNLTLPRGTFPLILSIAQIKTDQRVAFAIVQLSQAVPATWEMLTIGSQDISTLKEGELFGYGVDAGTGCFMDLSASRALAKRMSEQQDFYETLMAEMDKTYKNTWSWLDVKFGEGNLIAFSSGYGDGVYATYAGRDHDGHACVVVTDFGVLPFEKPQETKPKTPKTLSSFLIGLFRKS
jgi:hypothetical protein